MADEGNAAEQPKAKGWFDKTVNLGFVAGLSLQLAGFIWYGSKIDERVAMQEVRLARAELKLNDLDRDAIVRLARFEEKLTAILQSIQRLESASRKP